MCTIIKIDDIGKRYHIYLDNGMDFLLYKGETVKLHLLENMILDEEIVDTITDILYKRARERALYLLDDSYKTKKQIIDKLRTGYYPQIIIDKVINYLIDLDLVNDLRYAVLYVEYKGEIKSKRQLENDLYKKGIDKDTIQTALEQTGFNDNKSLLNYIEKNKRRYDLSDRKGVNKFIRYLLGKGYKYEDIRKCMEKYISEY